MKESAKDYKTIVAEMAEVLSRHHLSTREASFASAMMFIAAVETDLKEYPDSQREAFCHSIIQGFYANKNKSKAQMN